MKYQCWKKPQTYVQVLEQTNKFNFEFTKCKLQRAFISLTAGVLIRFLSQLFVEDFQTFVIQLLIRYSIWLWWLRIFSFLLWMVSQIEQSMTQKNKTINEMMGLWTYSEIYQNFWIFEIFSGHRVRNKKNVFTQNLSPNAHPWVE